MKRLLAPLVVLLLAGCTQYALIAPEQVKVGTALTVRPETSWNRVNAATPGSVEIWTADGPSLDSLMFFHGIADGEPLLDRSGGGSSQAPLPAFRSTMTPTEIMELFEATMAQTTRSTLAAGRGLRPADFGGAPGFRFDFAYTGRDEIERDGFVTGAIKDDELYLIFFQGTRLYHHEKHRAAAEAVAASAKFL